MKKILLIAITALFITACGGGSVGTNGTNSVSNSATKPAAKSPFVVKVNGKDVPFEMNNASVEMSSINSQTSKAITPYNKFIIRNYEYDTEKTGKEDTDKKLTASGQTRIIFFLYGDPASGEKAPPPVGNYISSVKELKTINSFHGVSIRTFAEGNDEFKSIGLTTADPQNQGEIKITSVTADEVTGEINVVATDGSTIKGQFTAKLIKAK